MPQSQFSDLIQQKRANKRARRANARVPYGLAPRRAARRLPLVAPRGRSLEDQLPRLE